MDLIAWIVPIGLNPPVINSLRDFVSLSLAQGAMTFTKVGPAHLKLCQRLQEGTLCLGSMLRLETEGLFSLTNMLAQIIRHALARPIHAGLGMLPEKSHRNRHVYHPCVQRVPASRSKHRIISISMAE